MSILREALKNTREYYLKILIQKGILEESEQTEQLTYTELQNEYRKHLSSLLNNKS